MDDDLDYSAAGMKKLRQSLGLSAVQFARALGLSDSTIYRWESSDKSINSTNRRIIKRFISEQRSNQTQSIPAFKMVDPDKVHTLEEYAASLVGALITLKTLHKFCDVGLSQGFLSQDEIETATTIAWETRRLKEIYNRHLEEILDRTNLTKEDILASLANIEAGIYGEKEKKKTYSRR
jgi:DNA-binding XRE family transcriptional regulator